MRIENGSVYLNQEDLAVDIVNEWKMDSSDHRKAPLEKGIVIDV